MGNRWIQWWRNVGKLAVLLILFMVLWIGHGYDAQAADQVQAERIAGADRYATAVRISREGWFRSDTVILARGDLFADALTGTPLAYHLDAPILLTQTDQLPEATKKEIERLRASHIIVLGQETAVSRQVVSDLRQIDGVNRVERIGGVDRLDTALQVAEKLPHQPKAVLAYGLNFPDALSIAPYAAREGLPILLTDGKQLDRATERFLAGRDEIILMGGTAVIGAEIEQHLKSNGQRVTRLGGQNRYDTAVLTVKRLPLPTEQIMVTTGENFADALTGSVLAAKQNMPLLLTYSARVAPELQEWLDSSASQSILVVGGTTAVSERVFLALQGIEQTGVIKIFLDPGHGGKDPGAMGNGLREKEVALDIALRTGRILAKEYKNVEVRFSREDDRFIELDQRVAMANQWEADYFISFHHNAGGGTGLETYIYNKTSNGKTIEAQKILHQHLAEGLAKKYGIRDRGAKQANFAVLRGTRMPAILLELLFVDREEDARLLQEDRFRQDAARLIAEGVAKVWHLPKK